MLVKIILAITAGFYTLLSIDFIGKVSSVASKAGCNNCSGNPFLWINYISPLGSILTFTYGLPGIIFHSSLKLVGNFFQSINPGLLGGFAEMIISVPFIFAGVNLLVFFLLNLFYEKLKSFLASKKNI